MKRFHDCTILRTFIRKYGTLNMATGASTSERQETVTEPCNLPLFGDVERKRGVCRSCAKGWEVDGNKFANDGERSKARGSA